MRVFNAFLKYPGLGGLFSIFVFHAVLAQPAVPSCSKTEVTVALESRLQENLEEMLAESPGTPGILVHVEAPARCLSWSGAAGMDDRSQGSRLAPDQTFRIASNTKTYTAAAILRLVEEGELSLDDTLDQVLPAEWKELLRSGGYPLEQMTLKHLLTHTSGLFDHAATREYMRDVFGNPMRQWSREEQIRYSAEYGGPHGAPGEVFSYSDTGYVILGGLLERVTGKNMARAFRELLDFEGLGLSATWLETYEERPASAAPRAHQYLDEADTHDWNPSMDLYGGGGLVTSARDLAVFVRRIMEGRVFEKRETLHTMLSTKVAADQRGYRIGIQRIEVDGEAGWGHTGFWNTFAYHFPGVDLTVAGSVNQQQGIRGTAVAARLVRALLQAEKGVTGE